MIRRLSPVVGSQWALNTADLRILEARLQAESAPGALMELAGLAAAQWFCALAPNARQVAMMCGPGNNGGDGLVMARWLHGRGIPVTAVQCGQPGSQADRRRALEQAVAAGTRLLEGTHPPADADVVVDALLGIGAREAPRGSIADALGAMVSHPARKFALDLPSGLDADQGGVFGADLVCASEHTLTFLAPKPGLFTGQGRQLCGELWIDDLGSPSLIDGNAMLLGSAHVKTWLGVAPRALAARGGHKGRQGDTWVIAGEPGMHGAARLAARAALFAGAGRVYLVSDRADAATPELMHRDALPSGVTVVAGCGGGNAVATSLPMVMATAAQLVLDADALNAIAADTMLRAKLSSRLGRTVLTPHPLEAARLLGTTTQAVQDARLSSAQALADELRATVVLKGSGTVVAHPGAIPMVCTTGHAALATAGTGDVLAGWIGGLLAQAPGASTQYLAALAATWHGSAADTVPLGAGPLVASALIERMASLHPAL